MILASLAIGCSEPEQPIQREENAAENSSDQDIIIRLAQDEYVFTQAEAAQGVRFDYKIIVPKELDSVIPIPQDAGHASGPGPSGLYPFEEISGNGNSYSLRDIGLAPPTEFSPRKIAAGEASHSFAWEGRNWGGPSDTDNPQGEPFPPGTYTIKVRVIGEFKTPNGSKPYEFFDTAKVIIKP